MTTIITRLFPDHASAQKAADRLIFKGIPKRDCTVIAAGDDAKSRMADAQVHASSVDAYARGLASGNAVLAVRATYKPLGAVQLTHDILDRYDTVDVGRVTEEQKLAWKPDHAPSVMKDHPLFLTVPGLTVSGPVTSSFGMRMTKPHRDERPLTNRRSSRMFWPMKLVSQKKRTSSVFHGGRHMSRMFWPMPLLSGGERRKSVIPGGGLPLSRRLGIRTTT